MTSPRRCQREKRRQGQARVNGPPLRSAETQAISILAFLFLLILHSHRRANTWGLRAPQANMSNLFSSTRLVGPGRYTRDIWACAVTRARVYRAVLQRRLCRPPRQQSMSANSLHNSSTISPGQHAYPDTVHAGQQPVSRAQTLLRLPTFPVPGRFPPVYCPSARLPVVER